MYGILANSALGFWCLAIFITVADSVVLLEPAQFTFRFKNGLSANIRATKIPFLILRRELLITLLVYPAKPFHFCSLSSPSQNRIKLRNLLRKQRKLDDKVWLLTVFSINAIVLLCFVGPALSLRYGIQASFLFVWPAIYANAILILVVLWINRRQLKLSHRELFIHAFDFLICPILAINVWKKLACRNQLIPNAESLATHFTSRAAQIIECMRSNFSEKNLT